MAPPSERAHTVDIGYDGAGNITIMTNGSRFGTFIHELDGGEDHYYIRDLDGKVLSEFRKTTSGIVWERDYLYRGSQMVAVQDATEGLQHFHLDHLGSPRMVTDNAGTKTALHNYGPFGFEISTPDLETIDKRYTGHERDYTNSPATKYDLDYMHARYYSPWQHRFLSVDPIGGDPRQPQSWNAYSYVLNNPINLVDPYGLVPKCTWDGQTGTMDCTEDAPKISLPLDWFFPEQRFDPPDPPQQPVKGATVKGAMGKRHKRCQARQSGNVDIRTSSDISDVTR